MNKVLRILGTRGIPARYGGFETFCERLSLHLVGRGWRVVVYCQDPRATGAPVTDSWRGIERVSVPAGGMGAWESIVFDWKATRHACAGAGPCLTLGYNTAVFTALLCLRGLPNLINMDGIEWRRGKWGPLARAWLRINELAGCLLADHLVADHPEIARFLEPRGARGKTTVIPYGADPILAAPAEPVRALGLEPGRYVTVIARPEPENSILEIVRAYRARQRTFDLAVIGAYDARANEYHRAVMDAALPTIRFLGAIYDSPVLGAVRFHALAHAHGHTVGGTNPSLVEALAAGNAILAQGNRFNRWVAGDAARYFDGEADLARDFDLLDTGALPLDTMRAGARRRALEEFAWDSVLARYEALVLRYCR